MTQPTSDPMSYLEPIKQSSLEIKNAISQLSLVFPNEVINMRLVNWLWHFMGPRAHPGTLPSTNYNTPQGLIDLAKAIAISGFNGNYEEIRTVKNSMMVNSNLLEWILQDDNPKRITNWLNFKKTEIGLFSLEELSPNETSTKWLITNIDRKQIPITDKHQLIQSLKYQWRALKSTDKVFTWFEKNRDQHKLDTAYAWLSDNLEKFKPTPSLMASQLPQQNFQNTTDLLIYFDKSTFSASDKILYIDRIKRRFNQAKYKESIKDKKQCNYVLKMKTISMLEELAEISGKSRTETLEELISNAYKKLISTTQK